MLYIIFVSCFHPKGDNIFSQFLADLAPNDTQTHEHQEFYFPPNIFSVSITRNFDHLTQKKNPRKLSSASLLQIAFRLPSPSSHGNVRCYVIDLLNCNIVVRNALIRFLQSPSILKVGFGIHSEALRLLSSLLLPIFNENISEFTMEPILDLQKSLPMISMIPSSEKVFSLAAAMHLFLGEEDAEENNGRGGEGRVNEEGIGRDETNESFDWEQRPIPEERLIQSSGVRSALSVMGLFDVLCDERESWGEVVREVVGCLQEGITGGSMKQLKKYQSSLGSVGEIGNTRNILFSGIFFSEKERKKLFEKLHPIHPLVYGDHVTLAYRPSLFHLSNLPLGTQCSVTVFLESIENSSRCQAVRVQIENKGEGEKWMGSVHHITLSCSPQTLPSSSSELFAKEPTTGTSSDSPILSLSGVVGVAVGRRGEWEDGVEEEQEDLLEDLPDLVKEKILKFQRGLLCFSSYNFHLT